MSMMYCYDHNVTWDSDFMEECPMCEQVAYNPVKVMAAELACEDWQKAMRDEARLIEDRRINAMSDNFAYTNGSDNWYLSAIRAAKKRRKECFEAYLYLA